MSDFDSTTTNERTIIDFSRFSITDIHRLGRYTYKHAHGSLPEHTHDGMMEICYCEKGLQVYEVNGQKYNIKGGDIFITFPGELHSTAHHPEEKGILYWLLIKIPDGNSFLDYNGPDAIALLSELLNLSTRHFKGSTEMKKMLDDIFTLHYTPQQPIYRVQLLNLLTNFLLATIQGSQKTSELQPSNRRLEISTYIASNLYNDLSVELLAEKMNFSDSHFKSWFKNEFGVPPADYVLRLRIEEAKKLLQTSGENTVTDTAYQLNFSSSQYFATVFKKYTGVTPTEYKSSLFANA
jgi:AraC-like DNA-binding protein